MEIVGKTTKDEWDGKRVREGCRMYTAVSLKGSHWQDGWKVRGHDRQGRRSNWRCIRHRAGNRVRVCARRRRVVVGDIDVAGAENTVAMIREMGGKAGCLASRCGEFG